MVAHKHGEGIDFGTEALVGYSVCVYAHIAIAEMTMAASASRIASQSCYGTWDMRHRLQARHFKLVGMCMLHVGGGLERLGELRWGVFIVGRCCCVGSAGVKTG